MKKITLAVASVLLVLNLAYAHEDHDHGKQKTEPSVQNYFSTEASSEKYEVLLKYAPIAVGEHAHFSLFVSEFTSNRALDSIEIRLATQEDENIKFEMRKIGPGIYEVETQFPEKKKYSIAVHISGPLGADLILLTDIEPGKELPVQEVKENLGSTGSWKTYLLIGLALLFGLGVGFFIQKRIPAQGKAGFLFLLFSSSLFFPYQSSAHEDHGESIKKQAENYSSELHVPKETQFLFNVITQKVAIGEFTESTKLFGTIIPSSNGQALVSTPQSGQITSLKVSVGEKVIAGQTLAVIEQNVDAGTQVALMTEENNLNAEFTVAKKEVERLRSISDIAAKKDLNEAEARFQKAEANLTLFKNKSGKTITLRAPIAGILSSFNLTIGSTVNAGQNLFTITNLAQLYAEAQVFDRDAHKVNKQASFTIDCSNDNHKTSEVKLISLAQEINATNQSQRVLFELKNPDEDFKIGEFVNIRVFGNEHSQKIALPNSALSEINGKPVVFIKKASEEYAITYVQLGENNGTHTSILKGVVEGDRVVTQASYQLKMIYLNRE